MMGGVVLVLQYSDSDSGHLDIDKITKGEKNISHEMCNALQLAAISSEFQVNIWFVIELIYNSTEHYILQYYADRS